MVRRQGGRYYTHVFGHSIILVYLRNNVCELYIDRKFVGLCPFDYVKSRITRLEKKGAKRNIEYNGTNLWQEAKKGTIINVSI
ncbi:hypothetical protein [Salibacterium aidingense]|uniref:hypothetical protein n=1 Tax=Salibacterium aidingense TaxID=384933 RepID=UPI003BE18603